MSTIAKHSRHRKPPVTADVAAQAGVALLEGDGRRKVAAKFGISRRQIPALQCVAEEEAKKVAPLIHGKLLRIENAIWDRLGANVDKLSVAQLPLAGAIVHDKRVAMEGRTLPSPRQTLIINGLSRQEALKYLTGGFQFQPAGAAPVRENTPEILPEDAEAPPFDAPEE